MNEVIYKCACMCCDVIGTWGLENQQEKRRRSKNGLMGSHRKKDHD